MMFLQAEIIGKGTPVLLEYGIAGVLLLVIFLGFYYLIYKPLIAQVENLQKQLVAKDLKIYELTNKNQEITEKNFQIILSHEKENIQSLNLLTNTMQNMALVMSEVKNKLK